MESWKDKWTSILSKLDTCVTECRACIRSNQKCKDSIEAVMADVWSLKDWLESDPAVAISRADLNAFVTTPEAFNIRGCADINTRDKHHTVLNKHRDNTRLQNEDGGVADDGYPVVFSATRNYGDGNADHWVDAVELALRASLEWEAFLVGRGLLPTASLSRQTTIARRPMHASRIVND